MLAVLSQTFSFTLVASYTCMNAVLGTKASRSHWANFKCVSSMVLHKAVTGPNFLP